MCPITTEGIKRAIPEVPEEVARTMLIFHAVSRKMLLQRLAGRSLGHLPNCHVLARAYARIMPNLEVRDGRVVICNSRGLMPGQHSWLRFLRHPMFGVDVAPCGAVPFMTFPNLIYFDQYAPFHEYDLSLNDNERSASSIDAIVAEIEPLYREIVQS